jgi:hypothetical protein
LFAGRRSRLRTGATTIAPKGSKCSKRFPITAFITVLTVCFFASGDWTCSIARFTGTMKGPMMGLGGKEIPPTHKLFEVYFCTVARWVNREIVEENLFYDVVGLLRQIGVGS